jgi:hypothetical protein
MGLAVVLSAILAPAEARAVCEPLLAVGECSNVDSTPGAASHSTDCAHCVSICVAFSRTRRVVPGLSESSVAASVAPLVCMASKKRAPPALLHARTVLSITWRAKQRVSGREGGDIHRPRGQDGRGAAGPGCRGPRCKLPRRPSRELASPEEAATVFVRRLFQGGAFERSGPLLCTGCGAVQKRLRYNFAMVSGLEWTGVN